MQVMACPTRHKQHCLQVQRSGSIRHLSSRQATSHEGSTAMVCLVEPCIVCISKCRPQQTGSITSNADTKSELHVEQQTGQSITSRVVAHHSKATSGHQHARRVTYSAAEPGIQQGGINCMQAQATACQVYHMQCCSQGCSKGASIAGRSKPKLLRCAVQIFSTSIPRKLKTCSSSAEAFSQKCYSQLSNWPTQFTLHLNRRESSHTTKRAASVSCTL